MSELRDVSSVGIMEGAFFVPRSELLSWLARDFQLSLSKVEQCASGAVYLQVVDAIYPGKVPMSKVNWAAKHEYEFVKNYKLLQQVFDKCEVKKFIDVDKLVKGKYQDNLEFLQWMKAFYDRQCFRDVYSAVARRMLGLGPFPDWAKDNGLPAAEANTRPCTASKGSTGGTSAAVSRRGSSSTGPLGAANPTALKELKNLKEENLNLRTELETAERERDFYFSEF
eukprot:GHVN01056673.1.p1 GENE.GHVN01056673.1~~GHVN01056673.1.p1  ORF type:complete len:225 (-),score=20.83 GHVN01056673.1:295-969(-)